MHFGSNPAGFLDFIIGRSWRPGRRKDYLHCNVVLQNRVPFVKEIATGETGMKGGSRKCRRIPHRIPPEK
jgi:hypothetical protein